MNAVKSAILIFFSSAIIIACSKKDNDNSNVLSGAVIGNVTQTRTNTTSVFSFKVSLDRPTTSEATIAYTTIPGSAKETVDFIPATGIVRIAANQSDASIDISVTGDSLRKYNQVFQVQLNSPVNCSIKSALGTGTIVNENGLYFPVDNAGYSTPLSYPGYTLQWNDEFTSPSVDAAAWSFESGNNNGWGNNELEFYTDRSQNVFQSQGNLIIEARREPMNGFSYTSTRMVTKNKKIFQFGRIDIRAKMPAGQGIWPALWMLGNNIDQVGWPTCGEIDILELLGQEPSKIYSTLHWGQSVSEHASKGNNYVLSNGSFDQQFHVYSMIWQQDSIQLLVDDIPITNLSVGEVASGYPFNNSFFFIFNIAVGGSWPGAPDSTTSFPQRMIVDYVRVFQ